MEEKNWLQRFKKSRKDKWIGGVCGGLGEHTPIPSWCWRFLFAFLFFFCGFGFLLYLLLWILVPKGDNFGGESDVPQQWNDENRRNGAGS
ncbi:MAG: PspC domain protein [Syntrophus sp. PtaU1.Bin005]|jgi:phage shock protein PspC (stress-responsive transcriptional regulator)|uniref:PspC domain-containing protein n=1 Tax=Syntrophus sp. (in: bacteria) TaxID=48412 RepID=UPI0009D4838F|nr:MAG: PspC domain protein [Syntrophus sp. PtaB.Bin138]OPY83002.1 MAG: PspC domain protein [Syntrophus sp. PtaU1.Bin005]